MGLTGASDAATGMPERQSVLFARLARASTPRAAAATIVELALAGSGCEAAWVAWGYCGAAPPETEPASLPDPADVALVCSAAMQAMPMVSDDGCRLAMRLSESPPSVLLVHTPQADAQRVVASTAPWRDVAGDHLRRALEVEELRSSLKRLERSGRLQHALFAISDLAGSDRHMPDMLRGIQEIVGSLMYAENFFIVLHDAERDTLRFLYFVDVEDPRPRDPDLHIPMKTREHSLTWYVLRDGKPLMGSIEQMRAQVSGPLAYIGAASCDWLGVPMLRDGHVHGAIVVQSYQQGIGFSADDRTLLEFVANHILTALERKQGKEDLEQRVRLRTIELQREVVERQHAERLQRALFQISELATTDISQGEFYRRIHAVVGELLNAENFYIGLLSSDGQSISFPYFLDGPLRSQPSRPLARGLSEYVLRSGKPLRAMREDINALVQLGEIDLRISGSVAVSWLGVPLYFGDETIGLIVIQSYDPDAMYTPADQELLSFVATQVANSLHRRRAAETLQQAYALLERRVQERTRDLTETLDQLRDTQGELVRQEKLASLGGLVAGIAHEINTPLGICVTATTHVQNELQRWNQWSEQGDLDAERIRDMFAELDIALKVLDSNIRRGADLVKSFKQVAVDRSSGHRRLFDLAIYLDEILLSLKPKLKHAPCIVEVDCPPGVVMDSFPGALSQVVTNLVMNALLHGFDGGGGLLRIHARTTGDDVVLTISDDGIGMPEAELRQYFDPFFTTKRGSGGTGLGAHVVFNQVTSVLGGTIKVTSAPGAGLQVQMRLPRSLGEATETA